jgi:hypothetical protein
MRFEPAGITNDPEIRHVSSVMDYVGHRLRSTTCRTSLVAVAQRRSEADRESARRDARQPAVWGLVGPYSLRASHSLRSAGSDASAAR